MIDIYYDPINGRTMPDSHMEKYCNENVQKVEHLDVVGTELLLLSYRYAMKVNNIPHDTIRFHFVENGKEYLMGLCSGYALCYVDDNEDIWPYPDFHIKMMMELL